MAGNQRSLSQRLVTASILMQQGKEYKGFRDELMLWNNAHEELLEGSGQLNASLVDNSSVKKMLIKLDPVQKQLFTQLAAIAVNAGDSSTVDKIVQLQAQYRPAMDKVMQQMELETEVLINEDNRAEIWSIILSGIFLVGEIFLIVVPYHRKLLVAYRKVKDQTQQIVKQSEKIAYQNDKLAGQNTLLEKMHNNELLTLNGINAGIWSWDIATGEEEWSPKFCSLLGYEPHQVVPSFSTFINTLLHPDDVQRVKDALDAHLKHDVPYSLNIRMRLKNGKYKWFEAAGQASRDIYGKPVRMAGSIIDIHEKVLYQQQLEATNRTKDKLFAIVAHDLRSPVAGIRALLDMAGDGQITREEFDTYIEEAKENLNFVSETLDNILQWALSQMQGLERKPDKVDLRKIINTLTNLYSNNASQKHIDIEVSITGNHYVYADPNQVFVALRNVLTNAIKFTPQGGKVHISVASKGGVEMISVADNGIGMAAEDIKAILQEGRSVSNIGTNGEKGTGLGLSLVMSSIRDNNGTVEIESATGEGTMVVISLPRLFV